MMQVSRIDHELSGILLILISIIGVSSILSRNTKNTFRHSSPVNYTSGLESVDVFQYGEGGFSCIRIPAITRCGREGTLHAFAECRMSIGDGCIPFLWNTTEKGNVNFSGTSGV